jgi:hypothetical protein
LNIAPAPVEPRPGLSFTCHGPFYRLQRRVGLLRDDDLAVGRRAALFMTLAWLPAVLLAALQGLALDAHHERAMLLDFSAWAFAIAIGAFVLMEQTSDRRMAWLVSEFVARGIVLERAREGFAQARRNMELRTGSARAEAVLLLASWLLSWEWIRQGAARIHGSAWFADSTGGTLQLTLAGWWLLLVALPLFWFLLGRWLWRFYTWGMLLRDIARCELRLVATHPDRCGGLAFIGQYPRTYVLFVFSISTVVAATVLKSVVYAGTSLMSFKFALLGLVVFLVVAFVVPLMVFSPVLVALKRQGLRHYGALVSRHNLAFEAKWIGGQDGQATQEHALGSPDMSSLADIVAAYQLVNDMRAVPVTKQSIVPLLLAAGAPLALVAATQAPFQQVLGALKGLLLF